MKRYQCHKQVNAFRIKGWRVDPSTHGMVIAYDGEGSELQMHRSKLPDDWAIALGGYAVQYDGGYVSWSPAAEFEAGYTEIEAERPAPRVEATEVIPYDGKEYAAAIQRQIDRNGN